MVEKVMDGNMNIPVLFYFMLIYLDSMRKRIEYIVTAQLNLNSSWEWQSSQLDHHSTTPPTHHHT